MGKKGNGRDFLVMVMELIEGKDIFSYFSKQVYERFVSIVLQICETGEFIHFQGYRHSDIKLGHILIDNR